MKETASVTRRQRLIVAVLLAADIVLAAAVGARFFFRLDLSRNRMYTLSATSKAIVSGLPEQVSLTYYVSEKLRGRYPFPGQIEDLLNEYAGWSRGKVAVASVDPAKSKRPIAPEQLGIAAEQMQVVEREETSVATVYSGIVIQYLDRTDALPFVTDLTTLEYDLSSKIRALVSGSQRTIGILLGNAQTSLQQNYRYLQQELGSQFELREVQKGKEVPADLALLFVIGSRDLDPFDALWIDQFVMRGGRALIAVDSVDVNLAAGLTAAVSPGTAVAEALAGWGVRVTDALVLDTLNQRISFRMQQGQYMVVNYPHWITVSDRDVARDNPITARFAGLDLYWPCRLEVARVPGIEASEIVKTTPNAWTMEGSFETNPALSQILAQQAAERAQFPLVVALSGEFASSFADRPVPARPGESPPKGPLPRKSPPTRLLVVADADFASDMIQYTQAQYNLAFLSNCAEWLSQEDDLLAIKTRAQADPRLSRILDPVRRAAAMRASQAINVVVVPLLVVAAGVARLLLRRRKKRETPREMT
jgi:gliding-associated putative ABC transporter substrate-binding component GldG